MCGRCPLASREVPAGDESTRGHTQARDRPRPQGPRPRGAVRSALIKAGVELARSGGPDAVVLREVTRMVGVVPNAAYRHFADRDALLAAVRAQAVAELARRMANGMSRVRAGAAHTNGRSTPADGSRQGIPRLRPRRARPLRHRIHGHRTPEPGRKRSATTIGISPGGTRLPRQGWTHGPGPPTKHRIPDVGDGPRTRSPFPRAVTLAVRSREDPARDPNACLHRGGPELSAPH